MLKPLLMSKENPTGYKLEELLERISHEMVMKNEKIKHSTTPQASVVRGNNFEIINHLNRAKALQEENFKTLAEIAKDEGPTGKNRI